ncbi:Holliday junction resolvase RecU [Anaerocolumna sedimenticola]|uniref:Holliday junction resolvase RecU n=1 Tax=Anaerocolumna sedimenticola TaxID=2696063 RepID=A0A6P1TQE5_9FIRM|nr:Holliday junction resolvase RecU [Anaerocolumna sedimenticola]QHQ62121.1 Holliday junction resolvase RecU [Anaerocolumna sedimenticola]
MPSWNSRGLRGSALEELINITNTRYREKKLALIQKIPTPITPTNIDKEKRHITLAYFEEKSTVDYIGVVQGVPVCFDAKECATDTFALQNVHEHQVNFMRDFEEQGGIAFLLIYYSKRNFYYYLPFKQLSRFWDRAKNGGRKSFRFEELDLDHEISCKNNLFIHYLENIAKDIECRDPELGESKK